MDMHKDVTQPATRKDVLEIVSTVVVREIGRLRREMLERFAAADRKTERLYRVAVEALETAKSDREKVFSRGDMLQSHESRLRDHGRRIAALEAKS